MNSDFADGLAGWTVFSDTGSVPGAFEATQCGTARAPCLVDSTGVMALGSNVLVSTSAHTVLPGESLSVAVDVVINIVATRIPDSMHYLPPPAPGTQARIDVYDAGYPGFPSAASLRASAFDEANIGAVPYLGNLIDADEFRVDQTIVGPEQ